MNFDRLDLNLLRVFDAVMAERNLTRAAERLSLSQPAVSNALRRLREALADELLIRVAHGVRPTPRAEALWPDVRLALERLQSALEPPLFDPASRPTSFRLAMADATAALLLPLLVADIERERALTDLRVVPLPTRNPSALLEHDEADIAIGRFPEAVAVLASHGAAASLRREHLYANAQVCVMRRGHPLAAVPLTLDTFCAAHHLMVSLSGRPHGMIDQALAAQQRARRIVLTVNQYFTAVRVVARTDLLTVLPAAFVAATGHADQVVERELPLPLGPVHVVALWHRRHDSERAHQWLRERLAAAVQQAGIGGPQA